MLELATRPKINGIDLEAIDDMVGRVRDNPARGVAGFRVTTEWKGQTRSETNVESFTCGGEAVPRSFTIVSDEPRELLGCDAAPNPQELLLSALNACMIVGYVVQAALRGIILEDCRIETESKLDLRGFLGLSDAVPPGYESVDYEVRIKGDGSPADFEDIHQTVMKTSPNYFNMSRPIKMNGTLRVG